MMEYLHRTLQKLKKVHDFNFHSKREKLHIINLSFADDLLIFNQGDTRFIELVMEKLKGFSRSTGLQVSPSKCEAYYGGVKKHIKDEIKGLTLPLMNDSYPLGTYECLLPVRSCLFTTT